MNATNQLADKRARPTITALRPEDVKRSAIGAPSLVLGGKYRLSKRLIQEMCGDVFDVDM